MRDLKGKVAVVTGGASGIGRAMADRFAAEGMKIVLADIEEEALARAQAEMLDNSVEVASKVTDVSKRESVEALADFSFETFGGVHVLCNNAGVAMGGVSWQNTVEDWDWMVGVNLWGVIHGIRAFVPRMIEQGDESHIVNTASGAGLQTRPFLGMYCATKHAVVALSESLYHELSLMGTKTKVSVVCPAVVNTRIGESQRNRPEAFSSPEGEGNPAPMQAMEQAFRAMLASGLAPAHVAGAVLDAILTERFYVITHEETKEAVRDRMENILAGRNPTFRPII